MLTLVTGTPGAGKTLNTIKFVCEADHLKDRDVYYYGIKDLNPDLGWSQLTEDEALKWYELPSNAVIIFDEAYTIFPTSHASKQPPHHVMELATHRHKGFDIFLLCQKVVGQLHSFVRGLVGTHLHYARIFNSNTVNRFEWTSCQENPNSASVRKNANTKTQGFDKKYFGVYHSADAHTHKMSLPWSKIVTILVCATLAIGLCYLLFSRISGRMSGDAPATKTSMGTNTLLPASSSSLTERSLSFADKFSPEITGIPWSAPIYSELLEPKSWPRPAACIRKLSDKSCSCYTQQATPLDVSDEFCNTVVDKGFFDHTKIDLARAKRRAGEREPQAHNYPAIESTRSRVTYLADTSTRTLSPSRNRLTSSDAVRVGYKPKTAY